MVGQVVTLRAIQRALSSTRLARYRGTDAGEADVEVVARYLWNMALQATLVPALHVAELTIRNAVFDASATVANTRGRPFAEITCWLDTRPSLLFRNEEQAVEEAKDHLRANSRSMTPGHLVSKLSFGFWVNLLNASYEQGRQTGPALWPAGLRAFHGVPTGERSRSALRMRFDNVRRSRNRVFHHEPLWDRRPDRDYDYLLETLRYLNPGVARAVAATCRFPGAWRDGEEPYRAMAEALLGKPRTAGGTAAEPGPIS